MIRQATIEDLPSIATVHSKCFQDSFSTALGLGLLEKFYFEYISKIPELFLVCENDDHSIIGFCMGYYMEENHYMRSFISNNRARVVMKLICRLAVLDKRAWKKVLKRRKVNWVITNPKFDDIPRNQRGDLLSICVLKEYRGNDYANQMISEFQRVLKQHNRKICMLSVSTSNLRGIRFYEKKGFEKYREGDRGIRTYAKLLDN